MTQETIGRYKLLQELGEGGFGVVYQAEQTEPVRRVVALKVVKLGMDTKQVIARFEAERQALALMDHPNIAKVLDAGATDSGRPYFVMELVKGIPITEYCDRAKLDTGQRLALFVQVCHAVQHAHQKGIIHRDLKPGNVLVALHDGQPVPKVIDFGIAKATDRNLTDKTLFTEYRQMIGTPEYMAPEQAEMSGLDIDTRADVYSLGVLLYELLTGTKPFDIQALLERGYEAILQTIREVDPPKPSTRASTTDRVEPGDCTPLARKLKGELDWIVMKALEKDRARRYATANSFALDLQRYLDDEPVVAAPPSALYRARKYARRHRAGVVAASLVLLVLLTGVGFAFAAYARAVDQQRQAEAYERDAESDAADAERLQAREAELRARAEADETRAKTQAAKANMVLELIGKMLGSADPASRKGRDYTVRAMLEDFERDHEAHFKGEPEVEAAVRATLADAYAGIGLHEKAEAQRRAAK